MKRLNWNWTVFMMVSVLLVAAGCDPVESSGNASPTDPNIATAEVIEAQPRINGEPCESVSDCAAGLSCYQELCVFAHIDVTLTATESLAPATQAMAGFCKEQAAESGEPHPVVAEGICLAIQRAERRFRPPAPLGLARRIKRRRLIDQLKGIELTIARRNRRQSRLCGGDWR